MARPWVHIQAGARQAACECVPEGLGFRASQLATPGCGAVCQLPPAVPANTAALAGHFLGLHKPQSSSSGASAREVPAARVS